MSDSDLSREELEEERAFVARSLEDLDAEHAAGDLDDAQHANLRARYTAQIAAVEASIAALGDAGPAEAGADAAGGSDSAAAATAGRPRRGAPRWLPSRRGKLATGWGGFACLVVAVVILILALAKVGPFAPPAQLTVNERIQIELAEAGVLGSKGDVSLALSTYDKVLQLDPNQPIALRDGGWLARAAGLASHSKVLVRTGDAEVQAAVRLDPGDPTAHAYDGVLLFQDRHDAAQAVQQFTKMLADRPNATLLWSIRRDALKAYAADSTPAPAALEDAVKPPA